MRLTEEEKKANKAAINKKWREANREKVKAIDQKWRENNREKIAAQHKKHREANKEKIVATNKKYYKTNQEEILARNKAYKEANPEKSVAYSKIYREENKEKMTAYKKEYRKDRRKSDPLFRLIENLRGNARRFLKGDKSKRTEAILGMTFKDFELYLEVDYTEGMELDHVVPVSWATTDDEVYCLNHFSNFQILTAEENLSKGNRFVREENLERTLEFHNNTELLSKIIERNLDRIT